MALWMEAGSEPTTESEKADLDAISALKESAALEFKAKGNECVRRGKKHYSDAIDFYTRAINQKVLSDSETSILFSNRAHVNLLLENYRRGLTDTEEAIRLCPTNVKAFYRAAKAALSLNLLNEAKSYCDKGINQDPSNEELKKLLRQVNSKKQEQEQHEAEASRAVADAKACLSAIESRGVKIGKAKFRELTGLRKPVLDRNNILHWPVLLLYVEVMTSDFIEDFCETDMFSTHLDVMFSEGCLPLPWDRGNNYTRDAVELYYEAGSGTRLSRSRILRYLLEGTAGSQAESIGDEDNEAANVSNVEGPSGMIRMNERRTLHDVLKEPNFLIPEIPVFYVVSRRWRFYEDFKAGKWTSPY